MINGILSRVVTLDKEGRTVSARTETVRELQLEQLIREIAETMSWEQQAVKAEIALAFIENRAVEDWVLQQVQSEASQ